MRWTTGLGLAVGALGLTSCVYGYRTVSFGARYSMDSRPDRTYYCYDCHGYRFFDPYYDYCAYYGFRYRWDEHPAASGLYRQRYLRIRQAHPEYGRYRYHEDYRASGRYRDPASYEEWRKGPDESQDRDERRESRGRREGWKERKGRDEGKKDTRKDQTQERGRGGERPQGSRQGEVR